MTRKVCCILHLSTIVQATSKEKMLNVYHGEATSGNFRIEPVSQNKKENSSQLIMYSSLDNSKSFYVNICNVNVMKQKQSKSIKTKSIITGD